jgi:hypothetical protein
MITPLSPSERLLFSTVRISIETKSGALGVGTGFFFSMPLQGDRHIPLIVTNNHVIADATTGNFYLHEGEQREGRVIPTGRYFEVAFNEFEQRWTKHPNPNVDLCAMPFQPIRQRVSQLQKDVFFKHIDSALIWSDETLSNLSAVEDVVMVGYPIGMFDEQNNLPIFRRGITATHPSIDFRGKREFLIDIAAFPGSSGSPVMLLNENGTFHDKRTNSVMAGQRVAFLGVLHAGPFMNAEGEIIARDIPTNRQIVAQTPVMINLGYVIKASEVLILAQHVTEQLTTRGLL